MGYLFFTTAWSNGLFFGSISNVRTLVHPMQGMLYLPWFGILIAVLIVSFLLTLERTPMDALAGVGGIFLGILAFYNVWLMPFNCPHMVHIPILGLIPWVNLSEWMFPADPQISLWIIGGIFTLIMAFARVLPGLNTYYNINFFRALILVVTAIMFGQQFLIFMMT